MSGCRAHRARTMMASNTTVCLAIASILMISGANGISRRSKYCTRRFSGSLLWCLILSASIMGRPTLHCSILSFIPRRRDAMLWKTLAQEERGPLLHNSLSFLEMFVLLEGEKLLSTLLLGKSTRPRPLGMSSPRSFNRGEPVFL